MRCVMVMFDSLNRHYLPCYGNDWVHAPNFTRLARRAVTFGTSYVCSMPCMPARRDLHTGRPNFLHRSWGPLEPFDDSCIEMLSKAGVQTHLSTDHYHYFEDGGCTYHTRYDTWELFRGQEGDPWFGQVRDPEIPPNINGKGRRQDWVNRTQVRSEADHCQVQTVAAGVKYIDRNAKDDRWFLQIECFDPHEPWVSSPRYRDLYPRDYDGPLFDWPGYRPVTETPAEVEEARRNYAALLSMCDASLGDVLDAFDRHDLWKDTMLVVWTDHGFLLGEHGWWAKNEPPLYAEVAHTPFFVWDPRVGAAGERRSALVQPAIDLAPTMLDFFGLESTRDMLGKNLRPVLESDQCVRDAAIFGYHNRRVNITDGRYVYLRDAVSPRPADEYSLMPTRMRGFIESSSMLDTQLARSFSFTKQLPVLRFGRPTTSTGSTEPRHLLFDLQSDPKQEHPIHDAAIEARLCAKMREMLADCDAPVEQYERMGL
jgi:arylsulfatase A-like enzyme